MLDYTKGSDGRCSGDKRDAAPSLVRNKPHTDKNMPQLLTSQERVRVAALVLQASTRRKKRWTFCRMRMVRTVLWTGVGLLAFLLLGYHPDVEDGGIYAAALAARLDPSLFAHDRLPGMEWVVGQTRLSLFVPFTAGTLRLLHLSLPAGLLLLQMCSVVGTVLALRLVAASCFRSTDVAGWATLLVAVAAGLPLAGTSLYLMDPYVTARSLSTPLLLLAAAACLRHQWLAAAAAWLLAGAMHPLMAAWGGLPLMLLWLGRESEGVNRRAALVFVGGVLAALGSMWVLAPRADVLVVEIAQTRGYWFLSQWQWYEIGAMVAPLATLLLYPGWPGMTRGWTAEGRQLATAAGLSVCTGLLAAILFVHASGRTMAIARLQPMRTLHFAYAVFLLLVAGTLADRIRQRQRAMLILLLSAAVASTLVLTQRVLYPASAFLEVPGVARRSAWQQAFAWCREQTPASAVFALDSRYTQLAGEDTQGFRAIAHRSVLPDNVKDAGIAAVVPSLAEAWSIGNRAQFGFDEATDEQRRSRVLSLGASWMVLPASATTALPCPYRNGSAMVCRLR